MFYILPLLGTVPKSGFQRIVLERKMELLNGNLQNVKHKMFKLYQKLIRER